MFELVSGTIDAIITIAFFAIPVVIVITIVSRVRRRAKARTQQPPTSGAPRDPAKAGRDRNRILYSLYLDDGGEMPWQEWLTDFAPALQYKHDGRSQAQTAYADYWANGGLLTYIQWVTTYWIPAGPDITKPNGPKRQSTLNTTETSDTTIEDRLYRIQKLHNDGLLTDEEFETKRQALIADL